MGEGGQKVQTSYKTSQSWRCNVQHGAIHWHIHLAVYLKTAKSTDLKILITRKITVTMCGDGC